MNVLSLFTGIGGLDLGLQRAGMTIVGQVEIDPWCRGILAKHWPEVPRHDDVRTCADWWLGLVADTTDNGPGRGQQPPEGSETAREVAHGHTARTAASGARPAVDLVCGGFPCQPVSSAGRRLAQDDPRWLWPAMAQTIRRLRPAYALMENVSGLLARGMGDVLGDLAACGYDAEWDCVPASAVGAPHRRDRVWIVAYPQRHPGHPRRPGDAGEGTRGRDTGRGFVGAGVADADGASWPPPWAAGETVPGPGTVERPGRRGSSSGDHWAVEPAVGRSLDGLPHRLDRTRLINESLMAYWSYATTSEACPGQVLRMVRDTAPEEEIQRAAGGLRGVSAQEVLRSFLRELADHDHQGRIPLACAEAARAEMRSMRGDPQTPCPPCERGHHGHDPGEHSDALRELSQLLARCAGAAWAADQRTDAGPVLNAWQDGWEAGIPRVATGVPRRVDRLRGLGNAVVPQVAEHIGRLIMQAAS